MKTLAFFLFAATLLGADALPSPAQIQLIQEREARQRRMQLRVPDAEKPSSMPEIPRQLSNLERRQLSEAVSRFVTGHRKTVDLVALFQ